MAKAARQPAAENPAQKAVDEILTETAKSAGSSISSEPPARVAAAPAFELYPRYLPGQWRQENMPTIVALAVAVAFLGVAFGAPEAQLSSYNRKWLEIAACAVAIVGWFSGWSARPIWQQWVGMYSTMGVVAAFIIGNVDWGYDNEAERLVIGAFWVGFALAAIALRMNHLKTRRFVVTLLWLWGIGANVYFALAPYSVLKDTHDFWGFVPLVYLGILAWWVLGPSIMWHLWVGDGAHEIEWRQQRAATTLAHSQFANRTNQTVTDTEI